MDDILLEIKRGDDSILEELKPSSDIITGQTSVTTSGTAVKLLNVKTKSILVKANIGNTGNIFISGTGVTSTTGLILAPGESVTLDHNTAKKAVWIDAASNGDGVNFLAIK